VVVQAVHELYDICAAAEWGCGDAQGCRVVVIGRNLDKDALQASFAYCAA
jgi:G3E family GTPase